MTKRDLRSIESLRAFLAADSRDWSTINVLGLDLRRPDIDHALLLEEFSEHTAFLGCLMSGPLARKAASAGSLLIPARPGLPFESFRGGLYTASDLLRGYDFLNPDSYERTPDWLSYIAAMDPLTRRKRATLGVDDLVHFRFHDLAIEDALDDFLRPAESGLKPRRVVGIMGGHDRERFEKQRGAGGEVLPDDSPYMQVALLARALSRSGFTIATGGGPGAMEASNLGAWFASRPEDDLRAAVRMLERVPKLRPKARDASEWNSGEWLAPAFEVMARFPRDLLDARTESVGVPTWFYGHEPPNLFASHIAKYFDNSLREEGVLGIATHGVVFAEGNAGTVQEIFQDACQNYYATWGAAAPMVLLGSSYWDRDPKAVAVRGKTVWPLLRQLGEEKGLGRLLKITDDIEDIVAFLLEIAAARA